MTRTQAAMAGAAVRLSDPSAPTAGRVSMRRRLAITGLAALTALGGCAHPISIQPDPAAIKGFGSPKVAKSVAYYLSPEDLATEVTSDGGTVSKVSYFPYRDLDAAIHKSLSEVYVKVTRLDTPVPPAGGSAPVLVFRPRIATRSAPAKLMVWTPTAFTVELDCSVTNAAGAPVARISVTGHGAASSNEDRNDVALSSRRASRDALNKFVHAVETTPRLR